MTSSDKAARRHLLFRETPIERLQRASLGTARALAPARLGAVPLVAGFWAAGFLKDGNDLPDPAKAPMDFDGVCGIARDLSAPTLLKAHRAGLHPAAHAGPIKWWSPPRRCVLQFENFHMSRRLRARLRQDRHRVTFDRDFDAVVKACAEPRAGKWPVTWITPKIMRAYAALHDAGHAHSFEVRDRDGALVGGGYGVAIGRVFVIESQFARESHASKIGFSMLNWHLAHWGFALNDNKGPSQNVLDMGFHVITRDDYLTRLACHARGTGKNGRWEVETDLAAVAAWEPKAEAKSVLIAAE
ncbi:MAG: leucyl/phenylalanyl-tRNA--protein transferase [Pseudorhodoplanes sp.]|nr:leucyl/phenylalanyl-tRNA--protein transferase [Pseudorhodoplanes sp.]